MSNKPALPLQYHPKDRNYVLHESMLMYMYRPELRNG